MQSILECLIAVKQVISNGLNLLGITQCKKCKHMKDFANVKGNKSKKLKEKLFLLQKSHQ